LLHDAVYDRPVTSTNCQTRRILSLQRIIGFEKKTSEISEIAAEFGFFPVSTKRKAQ